MSAKGPNLITARADKAHGEHHSAGHRRKAKKGEHEPFDSAMHTALAQVISQAQAVQHTAAPTLVKATRAVPEIEAHKSATPAQASKAHAPIARARKADEPRELPAAAAAPAPSRSPAPVRVVAEGVNEPAKAKVKAAAPPPRLAEIGPEDSRMQGAVLRHAAHVSVEDASGHTIGIHLRVKDGVAEVRLEGAAPPLAQVREADLRVALASEGLLLGGFELASSDRHTPPEQRPELVERAPSSQPARTASASGTSAAERSTGSSGVHIEA